MELATTLSDLGYSHSPSETRRRHGCKHNQQERLRRGTSYQRRLSISSRASQLKNEILGFQQLDGETLYEAWERYKDLLRRCPNHELPKWVQVQTFYNGSLPSTQETIDAASGGSLNNKTLEEAEELIKTLASKHYAKSRER